MGWPSLYDWTPQQALRHHQPMHRMTIPMPSCLLPALALVLALALAIGCGAEAPSTPSESPAPSAPAPTSTSMGGQTPNDSSPPAPAPVPVPLDGQSPNDPSPPAPAPTGGGSAATPTPAAPTASDGGPVTFAVAFPDLPRLADMVHLTHAGDGSGRLYVVLQEGRIVAFNPEPGVSDFDSFLDIRDRVRARGEQGLLGLAFAPDYASSGHLYVNYTTRDHTIIARYTASPDDPDYVDPDSELVVMRVEQPFDNHNGGTLAFGPDGYLYIGLGDGGAGGDPLGSGQDLNTLLGAMLRIDVAGASESRPYTVPADNPFINQDARPEIWAYGLRNPWRFSFSSNQDNGDQDSGDLWAADVGQNDWEEVNILQPGKNYGWNIREGAHCFPARVEGCDDEGLEAPIIEYPLSGSRCAVIGGVVYRGPGVPSLNGAYLYADYCSGEVWSLRYDGASVTDHTLLDDSLQYITAFGEDEGGEAYLLSFDGFIYRLQQGE